ncbi:hypothetical protein A3Q56_04469 [Intoshia linei]|uniref:Uncharacterized protein n=1 Tax=Intoshia linei TaxID=1819745 RepID=A0A177B0G1_9BILA|nr:hypothetical protein A3Q56_04469 [Intoshia linei]
MYDIDSSTKSLNETRGIKRGDKRGRYVQHEDEAKRQLLNGYQNGDWKVVVAANDVAMSTVYAWIGKGDKPSLQRGGQRLIKIREEHINSMIGKRFVFFLNVMKLSVI